MCLNRGQYQVTNTTCCIIEQLARGSLPETILLELHYAGELGRLAEYLKTIQEVTIALANGDLTASLKGIGGPVAGSLKSLQASLRHLT